MPVQKCFGGIINVDTVDLSQVSLTFSKSFLFLDANMWSFHRDVSVMDGSTMWDMTRHSILHANNSESKQLNESKSVTFSDPLI